MAGDKKEGATPSPATNIMIKRICQTILWIILLSGLAHIWYKAGQLQAHEEHTSVEQHDFCYDTIKYEAWVAKKNGIYRCFMENKQWPHRVRASHIDYEE